ncbi:MAG: SDR family oxidoreductase [Chloroflexota bacterium]|nr:SDR family oxidoreductase [Chloroflexota bacterium]
MNPYTSENLNHRSALVTGGSRGIGRAIALELAARGASVALSYRANASAAAEVVAQIATSGGNARAFAADMASPAAPAALVHDVEAWAGKIDILINNAGEMTDGAVESMPDDMWDQTLEVNLSSAFRAIRACIPGMKARGWGRIISITSQAAYSGSSNHAHYAAAKAGLAGLTYSLAKELGAFGITVNLIAPGRILTDMITERMSGREDEWLKQTPLRRFGTPEEVAAPVAFLASDAAAYITGATLHINGGLLMA